MHELGIIQLMKKQQVSLLNGKKDLEAVKEMNIPRNYKPPNFGMIVNCLLHLFCRCKWI